VRNVGEWEGKAGKGFLLSSWIKNVEEFLFNFRSYAASIGGRDTGMG